MSDLVIYGDPISGNCLKVKWTADRLGVAYRWVDVDVVKGETRTPHFLRINPSGQVPAVVFPDGRTLSQSNAIILHLAETHGGALIPADPFERARAYEWLFWEQYSHETAIAVRRFQKTYLKKPDAEIDPRLLERGNAALARMELQLGSDPWIAGSAFTVADIALVAYTRVAHEGGFDLRDYPLTKRWVGRVESELGLDPAPGAPPRDAHSV